MDEAGHGIASGFLGRGSEPSLRSLCRPASAKTNEKRKHYLRDRWGQFVAQRRMADTPCALNETPRGRFSLLVCLRVWGRQSKLASRSRMIRPWSSVSSMTSTRFFVPPPADQARKESAPINTATVAEIEAILDAKIGASRSALPITVCLAREMTGVSTSIKPHLVARQTVALRQ